LHDILVTTQDINWDNNNQKVIKIALGEGCVEGYSYYGYEKLSIADDLVNGKSYLSDNYPDSKYAVA
jgi:hypothetical protein